MSNWRIEGWALYTDHTCCVITDPDHAFPWFKGLLCVPNKEPREISAMFQCWNGAQIGINSRVHEYYAVDLGEPLVLYEADYPDARARLIVACDLYRIRREQLQRHDEPASTVKRRRTGGSGLRR